MNPLFGVLFHWLGGLAAGSFYAPYRQVRQWSWETYWLVGGLFSWLVAPWVFALLLVPGTLSVLQAADFPKLFWPWFFGVLWGVGGLTFGLTMRYLGMSLGMAVALGYCAVCGTLVPPLFKGDFGAEVLGSSSALSIQSISEQQNPEILTLVLGTRSGLTVLAGVAICVLGIAVAGMAGMSKERELPAAAKAAAVREFNFRKGLIVATISGVMSSCFAFGLAAGDPLKAIAADKGTAPLWQGLPVLIVVMAGGFTTNFIWCLILHRRNRSGREYFSATPREPGQSPVPLLRNWFFCALAGVVWYFQFFFYSMGESQMGKYGFSSWTMHMASIIIFSTLWGIALKEWKGTSGRTRGLLGAGLALLIFSTIVVGYGNFLGGSAPAH